MAASTSTPSLSFFSSSLFTSKPTSITKPQILPTPTKPFSIKSTLTPLPLPLPTVKSSTLPILNFSGDVVGQTSLTLKTAMPDTARAVVHRALITQLQNRRRGTASTLTRGEVRGGGIKPYPQKKTGRARRGSQRTPLRPGGGVIFGPKPKDWSIKLNKKEKRLALSTAIASAVDSLIVVEEFGDEFSVPKTKEFIEVMKRWGLDPKKKAMFFMMDLVENVEKSGRNIRGVKMLTPRSLNLFDVLDSDKLVLTPWTVDYLNTMYGVGEDDDDEEEVEEGDGYGDGDVEEA